MPVHLLLWVATGIGVIIRLLMAHPVLKVCINTIGPL